MQRVAAAYLKPSNRTVGVFIPTAKPDRAEIPPPVAAAAARQGLQGRRRHRGRRGLRPVARQHRVAHEALGAAERAEDRAAVQEDARRHGRRDDDRCASATRRASSARRPSADLAADMLMRGTTKHTRQQIKDEFDRLKARVDRLRRRATQANVVDRDDPREPSGRPGAGRRDPARAGVPGQGVRGAAAGEPRRHRAAEERARRARPERLPAPHEPVPEGRRALRRDLRRVDRDATRRRRSTRRRSSTPTSTAPRPASSPIVGDFDDAAVGEAGGGALRRLEEPGALRARAAAIQGRRGREQGARDPGQGQRLLHRRPEPPARGRRPRLPGPRARQLHARRRLPELAPRGPHPPEGRALLRRRLAVPGLAARQVRQPSRPSRSTRRRTRRSSRPRSRKRSPGFSRTASRRRRSPRPSPAGCSRARSRRAQDAPLARTLATDLYIKRTLAWDAALEKKVEALTGEQILAAMRKYLDPAKMTIVKAGDFAKGAAAAPAGKP